jgi:hypothetical protein
MEDTTSNSQLSSVVLSVVTGILCLATCYLIATRSLLSVVICAFITTAMSVYQTVVQQRSISRCHGNVFSNLLSDSDTFAAICGNLRIHYHGNECLPNRCPATVYFALPRECV